MNNSISICEVVFCAIESRLPDQDEDFNQLMTQLRRQLPAEVFNQVEQVCNERVANAQRAAFKVGWQMRGQV
jgi:hypothetical protein